MKTLILAAVVALLATSTAQAATPFQATVQVTDLNLQTQAGADTLISRLQAAAKVACKDQPMFVEHYLPRQQHACAAKAVAAAVRRLDAPLVTARLLAKDAPAQLASR